MSPLLILLPNKDNHTILVSKLQKLYGATANKNMDMVEVFLKSPNVNIYLILDKNCREKFKRQKHFHIK